MKAWLSNSASAALQHDPDLKASYQRKTQEGKGKMSALKAKIINGLFATLNPGKP